MDSSTVVMTRTSARRTQRRGKELAIQRHPHKTPSLLLPPGLPLGAYLPFLSAGKTTIKSQRINDMDVENLLRKQDCMLKGQYNVRDDAQRLCVDDYRQLNHCLAMAS
jgi:hypothetical protein